MLVVGLLVSGPSEDEEGADSDEDDWDDDDLRLCAILFGSSLVVMILIFPFRVWRKHSRQLQIGKQQQTEKEILVDDAESPSFIEVVAASDGTDTDTGTDNSHSWKYLCRHTAIEYAIVSTWTLVIVLPIALFSMTNKNRQHPWTYMSISYLFLFGAFALCTYWYEPVQRLSKKLVNLELLDTKGVGLLMFHHACAMVVLVSLSAIRQLTVDEPPWWWVPMHLLIVGVGFILILIVVPRRAAV